MAQVEELDTDTGNSPGLRMLDWAGAHLTTALAGAAVIMTSLRLLAVADFDPITGFAILQNVGVGNALIGMVLAVLPVGIGLGFAASLLLRQALTYLNQPTGIAWVLIGATGSLGFFLVPWPVLAGALVLAVAFAIRLRMPEQRMGKPQRRRRVGKRLSRLMGVFLLCYYVFTAVVAFLLVQPWFATEVVETSEGRRIPGYVLSTSAEQTALMRLSDRHVVYLDQPVMRTICHSDVWPGFPEETLLNLLSPPNRYPACPARSSIGPDGFVE